MQRVQECDYVCSMCGSFRKFKSYFQGIGLLITILPVPNFPTVKNSTVVWGGSRKNGYGLSPLRKRYRQNRETFSPSKHGSTGASLHLGHSAQAGPGF